LYPHQTFGRYNTRHYSTLSKATFVDGKRMFTREEVAEHNKSTDGWIIVDDKVYNVTTWIPLHPGGEKLIIDVLGKDATLAFRGTLTHSRYAYAKLDEFMIGYITTKRRFTCNEPSNFAYPRGTIGEEGGFH